MVNKVFFTIMLVLKNTYLFIIKNAKKNNTFADNGYSKAMCSIAYYYLAL